jgi:hydrogenase 3 maturation protease
VVTVENTLADWASDIERVVIVGIGNPLRRDDSVGVEVVKKLKDKVTDNNVLVIESENVPESFLKPITEFNPSHILLIDAALLGLEPGHLRFVKASEVSGVAVSTHALPLQIFCGYLIKVTGAKIGLLLIQPENVDFGEGLSPEVESAMKRVVKVLKRVLL